MGSARSREASAGGRLVPAFSIALSASIALLFVAHARGESEPAFRPAVDHASRSPEEWVRELDRGEGSSLEAVWSLFHHDERTPAVREALARWSREGSTEARRAIDAVLVHWGEPPELSTKRWFGSYGIAYQGGRKLTEFSPEIVRPFPAHPPGDEVGEDELLRRVEEDAEPRAAAAVVEAVLRGGSAERALRLLLGRLEVGPELARREPFSPDDPTLAGAWAWAKAYAGSAAGDAFASVLEDALRSADPSAELARLFELDFPADVPRSRVLDVLEEAMALPGDVADRAWLLFLREAGLPVDPATPTREGTLHHRLDSPEPEGLAHERLATALARRLELALESGGELPASLLELLHVAALRSTLVAERVLPLVEQLSRSSRPGALEALRIRCHLGDAGEEARALYLEALARWNDFDDASVSRVPCFVRHDAETEEALGRVVRRASRPSALVHQLVAGGLADARRSELAQLVVDRNPDAVGYLVHSAFRAAFSQSAADPGRAIHELAMEWAWAAGAGADPEPYVRRWIEIVSTPYRRRGAGGWSDYVQWGFWHAAKLDLADPRLFDLAVEVLERRMFAGGWSTHHDAARYYLGEFEWDEERHARWEAVDPWNARAKDGGWGRAAIETVPNRRLHLYRGGFDELETILEITRASPRDLDALAVALERGRAEERRLGLELIERHALETDELGRAVQARLGDADAEVRSRAAALVRERGW